MQSISVLKLRIGDYLLPVDIEKEFALVQTTIGGKPIVRPQPSSGFPLIGGGREINESGLECLAREVIEESENRIVLDISQVKKIGEFIKPGNFETFGYKNKDQFLFDGKLLHIYFYPLKKEQIEGFTFFGDEKLGERYDWVELQEYLQNDEFISPKVWLNFLKQNNIFH